MDHVIALLDTDHDREVRRLTCELATTLAIDVAAVRHSQPHITLVSYTGLDPQAAVAALAPVARDLAPVSVRAHGYGVFTGDVDSELSLHVMVVRTRPLDELHRRVRAALVDAGGTPDGTTEPQVWTPHITVLDRGLSPALLGRAVELLAGRPHRSWRVGIATLAVTPREATAASVAGAHDLTLDLG